jgi:hypothetical protein
VIFHVIMLILGVWLVIAALRVLFWTLVWLAIQPVRLVVVGSIAPANQRARRRA